MNRSDFGNLVAGMVRRAERSLDMDFGGVRFERGAAHRLGGLACAIGENVSLSDEAVCLPRKVAEFILAHELAHVAQKRLGAEASATGALQCSPRDVMAIEREADTVAGRILAGLPARCTLADDPARPAHWGPLGHYYTSYYVMLAAGCDPRNARIRAFFCQLPDQVRQFDATSATRDYHEYAPEDDRWSTVDILSKLGGVEGIERATPEDRFKYRTTYRTEYVQGHAIKLPRTVEEPVSRSARLARDLAVIRGLHCLTGGDSAAETAFRLRALQANWQDPILSGLALHPFGDSFAHRTLDDSGEMYDDHHGHLFDFHKPDYISQRPDNYIAYARALYDAIPASGSSKPPFAQKVEPVLRGLTDMYKQVVPNFGPRYGDLGSRAAGDPVAHLRGKKIDVRLKGDEAETAALKRMKGLLARMPGYDGSYEPEKNSAVYWKDFVVRHKGLIQDLGGQEKIRTIIMAAGERWKARQIDVGI